MLFNWSFFCTFNSITTEVFPLVDDLIFQDRKENDLLFLRRVLTTPLLFKGDDYEYFLAIEQGVDRCEKIEFELQFNGDTFWSGYLSVSDANWDLDLCEVSIRSSALDKYSCLLENWETEENILGVISKVTVESYAGEVQLQTCIKPAPPSPPDFVLSSIPNADSCGYSTLDQWQIVKNTALGVTLVNPGIPTYEAQLGFQTIYAREFWDIGDGTPPGSGWVSVSGGYARKLPATYDPYSNDLDPGGNDLVQRYIVGGYDVDADEETTFDNGMLLSEILEYFAQTCGLTVKSDFLGINPPGTAPSNDAYTAAASMQNIVVYQKTDVRTPGASDNATILNLSLKRTLEILSEITRGAIVWEIENDTDLRIEHISYFTLQNGTDLTVAPYADQIATENRYNYNKEGIPSREEFTWMDKTDDNDFDGLPITYPAACAGSDRKTELIGVGDVTTNIAFVTAKPSRIALEGMCWIACDKHNDNYYVNKEVTLITNQIKFNGHLSRANLDYNYARWNRYLPSGNLNGNDINFESYKRSKEQGELTVKMEETAYRDLDAIEKMKSGLGWGEVRELEWSAKACDLKIKLLHD